MNKTVLWLSRKTTPAERQLIGPKAASLCTLRRLGMKVPPCFFVTTTAFREHLDANGLRPQIAARLDQMPAGTGGDASTHRSRALCRILCARQIAAAYSRLGAAVVAVRSSATAEDLPGHSFAGQYETILGVKSLEECLAAIKQCWASLWTERAFEYRRHNGIDHQQVEMAVIVQRQIEPEAAGVAFSVDPVTGSLSRIVIESCQGLGEALVSGQVQPDRILLRKKNLELIRQNLVASEPSLDLKSARRLARSVRRIENRLAGPQDVEWALGDGTFWFLQARPITALPEPKPWEDRQVWTNLNLGEVVAGRHGADDLHRHHADVRAVVRARSSGFSGPTYPSIRPPAWWPAGFTSISIRAWPPRGRLCPQPRGRSEQRVRRRAGANASNSASSISARRTCRTWDSVGPGTSSPGRESSAA